MKTQTDISAGERTHSSMNETLPPQGQLPEEIKGHTPVTSGRALIITFSEAKAWDTDGALVWNAKGRVVCDVQSHRVETSIETCWANARLMAEAPMMLEFIRYYAERGDQAACDIIDRIEGVLGSGASERQTPSASP